MTDPTIYLGPARRQVSHDPVSGELVNLGRRSVLPHFELRSDAALLHDDRQRFRSLDVSVDVTVD